MNGVLKVIYRGEERECKVYGKDDLALTLDACFKILHKAIDGEIWMKGRITLEDGEGNILRIMEERGEVLNGM